MEQNENETIADNLKKSIVDEVTGTIKDTVKSLLDEKETAQKAEIESIKAAHKKDLEDALKNVNPFAGITVGQDRNEQPIKGFKSHRDAEITGLYLKSLHMPYEQRKEIYKRFEELNVKSHYSGNDASGGIFVPVEVTYAILNQLEQFNTYTQYGMNFNMGSDTAKMPNLLQEFTHYWIGETTPPTASKVQFGEITVNVKDLGVYTKISRNLLSDSAVNIATIVTPLFVKAINNGILEAIINGDGTSTYGGIVGLRNSLTNISATRSSIKGLHVGTGNLWSELTLADFRGVASKLRADWESGAKWYMSKAFFDTVVTPKIQAENLGQNDLSQAPLKKLCGFDIVLEEKMPRTQGDDQVCALLGNFENAAWLGNRQQATIESNASDGDNFANRQVSYLATARVGYTVYGQGDTTTAGSYVGLITAAS